MKKDKSFKNMINVLLSMFAGMLFMAFFVDMNTESLLRPQLIVLLVIVLIALFIFRKNLIKDTVILSMIGGGILKLCYVLYTIPENRQHDVVYFGSGEGHAAYIEYILANKRIPDFDPRTIWGFFQPPLHHIISAAWMWFLRRMGVVQRQMEESVQLLTLFYMLVVMLVTYLICQMFNMKKQGTLITMLIVSFHPVMVIMSGSINNDALALCLSLCAVYIALLWYDKPSLWKVIILALFIGLAMFAKLTSGLVAPAIGAIMLYSFIKNRDKWKAYLCQFAVFGVIVFPIGLYWPIRNMIRFNMPFNYIPEVGEQLVKTDFFSRVFDLRMSTVYPSSIANGNSYDEYNTVLMIFKSSLFGEYNYGNISGFINPAAVVLFIVSIVLALIALYATGYMIFSKKSMMLFERKLFLGILYASFLLGYLSFSLSYSNFSAQDFRYSALAIIIEALFLGIWADESEEKYAKIIQYLCIIFGVASFAVYLMIGFFQ